MSQSIYARLARQYNPAVRAVSRRDVLKAALAASGGLLLSNCMGEPWGAIINGCRMGGAWWCLGGDLRGWRARMSCRAWGTT